MKYGIGHLNIVPCRAEPSDRSEQTTQLLFGETIKVYESKKSWYRIKTSHDNYECWIDEKQFSFITQREYEEMNQNSHLFVSDIAQLITEEKDGDMMTVLLGSNLPNYSDNSIHINNMSWNYDGAIVDINAKISKSQLIENAFMLLNAPYQWGGRSAFGIDCSGFVQLVYKLNGNFLPRDASQQAKKGQILSFIEEAEEGDLAFFDNDEGIITHVGIILSNNRIIHASGKVRIDRLDHQGIYNSEIQNYSHRLRLITKVI